MLTVCCFRWRPMAGYRSSFGPETVNTLARMVRRHYPHPHRFVCITDDPAGLAPDLDVVPLWDDYAHVPNPNGPKNPSCYRRLRLFAPEMGELLGPRFVALDLDCVITADLTPLWHRREAFIAWGGTHRRNAYNASMLLMTAGARPQVWADFDPQRSPRQTFDAGHYGSDQAWISYRLGPHEAKWGRADGVYSFRNDLRNRPEALPANAAMVFFHGRRDPWSSEMRRLAWVQEHWC